MYDDQYPDFADKTAPHSNQVDALVVELSRALEQQIARTTVVDWYLLRLRSALGDVRKAKGLQ